MVWSRCGLEKGPLPAADDLADALATVKAILGRVPTANSDGSQGSAHGRSTRRSATAQVRRAEMAAREMGELLSSPKIERARTERERMR
jgi:hypothetical protein